jgi:hypothetical protein
MNALNDAAAFLWNLPVIRELASLMPIHRAWGWDFEPITFAQPMVLYIGLATVMPSMLFFVFKQRQPALTHSRLPARKRSLARSTWTIVFVFLAMLFTAAGTSLLVASLARPTHLEAKPDALEMSVDLHFIIDKSSGNMSEFIGNAEHQQDDSKFGHPPAGDCGQPYQWGNRKIDLSAYAACKIAAAFPHYRKTLATFDGGTQCCSPGANSDPRFFDQRIREVNQQLGDNNTNYETDTGAFNVILNFIEQKSKSDSRVLFLFTDGDGTMTDETINKFVRRIKEDKVILFCGGPGADTVATDPDTDAIVKLCHQSGGTIVNLTVPADLQKMIDQIQLLPPSQLMIQAKAEPRPIQGPFILVGFICLGLATVFWALLGRLR